MHAKTLRLKLYKSLVIRIGREQNASVPVPKKESTT